MRRLTVASMVLVLSLTACAHQTQVITRTVTPPPLLTQPVPKPAKPDSKTATQKAVAIYLVELNGALDLANFKLNLIQEWSETWTQSTTPAKKNKLTAIKPLQFPKRN